MLAVLAHELGEPGDLRDPAMPLGALEDDRSVVLALDRRLESVPAHDARPFAKQVDVARVVHLIDEVRAGWTTADLAEYHLPTRLAKPLHVREPVAHAERTEYAVAERDALRQCGLREIAHRDDHRAHPLVTAC